MEEAETEKIEPLSLDLTTQYRWASEHKETNSEYETFCRRLHIAFDFRYAANFMLNVSFRFYV